MTRCLTLLIFCLVTALQVVAEPEISASDVSERRALFNYQMFCQGCHAVDGSGHKSVPQLRNTMYQFMASQSGREYLVRVPGSANSTLDDEQLAELLNWMLNKFTEVDTSAQWQSFTTAEVAEYRQNPLFETVNYRRELIATLNAEPES